MTCPDCATHTPASSSRATVERPSKGDLEMTVHALHGIFWALNMIVGHKAADGIAPERQLAEGVDGLILAGRMLTEEVIERF